VEEIFRFLLFPDIFLYLAYFFAVLVLGARLDGLALDDCLDAFAFFFS